MQAVLGMGAVQRMCGFVTIDAASVGVADAVYLGTASLSRNSEPPFAGASRFFLQVSVMLLKLAILLTAWVTSFAVHADVITVAQVLPLNGYREVSTRAAADAADVYLRKVTDAGGVNGHTFNVVTVNATAGMEVAAQRVTDTIRQHRPAALLNYYGSARTAALIRNGVLDATHTPVIGASAASTEVRQDPNNHWVFYVRAGIRAEAAKMVEQGILLGGERVAILHQDDAFGEDGMRTSADVLNASGLKPVLSIPLHTGMMNSAELAKVAEEVLRANAGAILIFSDSINLGGVLRAYRERGGSAAVVTDSTLSADELVRASSAEIARGVCITEILPVPSKRNIRLTRSFVADMTTGGRPDLVKSTTALEVLRFRSFVCRGGAADQRSSHR
ncbi:ABC transporter substrate-binding protein [Ralstonia nicotianae]|uniref:ABC transporter substrate-binding protein n=1 Tax=Ralstonia pseudosolanacearum TaxID=1310165 RepID=UPI002005EBC5|nr:ABC transporter substrate-binding protein [Ralstonia pseudosolanacearum]